jgi:hypothetical protein
MGLLNLGDSDSDDDDDDVQRMPSCPPPGLTTSGSKHAALAAATASPIRANFSPVRQQQQQQRPQQLPISQASSSQPQTRPPVLSQTPQVSGLQPPRPHQPHITAPRPGYPAPLLVRPEPGGTPVGHPQTRHINPFERPYAQPHSLTVSPAPSTPHPLHPPVSPITPAFIRPSAPLDGSAINVKFSEANKAIPRKAIIRGNSEETLLPGRGEKGDDFWRRFSMVAKDGNERKER